MVKFLVVLQPAASVTSTAKAFALTVAVGVPLMTPALLSVSPAGSVPVDTRQL